MAEKWIELIKECAPRVNRVYLMLNLDTAAAVDYYMPSLRAAADRLDVELMMGTVRSITEISELVGRLANTHDSAIAVMPDPFPGRHRDLLVSLANRHL